MLPMSTSSNEPLWDNFKPKLSRQPKFTGLCRICTRTRRIGKTLVLSTSVLCIQRLHIHFINTHSFLLLHQCLNQHSKRQIRKAFPRPSPTPPFQSLIAAENRVFRVLSTCLYVVFYTIFFFFFPTSHSP
jgi:hypothetical protein